MDTVTHISGPRIEANGRIVQRCCLCGEKLCDSLNVAMPVSPGGEVPTLKDFATFPELRLVQVTVGTNPTRWLLLDDMGEYLPKDSCIDLLE